MSAAAATPFRSLVFRGTVPLQVQLEPQDLPLSADRSVGYYYLQVPRVSYLALCLDDIKRNLVQLVLDHAAFAALRDDHLWFETLPDNHQAQEGTPLKWHWPIGLLYDLHATSRHLGLLPPRPVTIPPSFASVFAPFDDEDGSQGQDVGASRSQELPELLSLSVGGGNATARRGSNTNTLASSSGTTLRGGLGGGPSSSSGAIASSSRLRTPSAPPRQHGGGAPPSSSSSTSMNRARSAAAAASAAVPASASTSISFPPSSSTAVSSPTTGGGNEVTMATRPWRIRLRIRNLKGADGGGASTSSSSESSSRTAAAAVAAAAEAVGVLDAGGGGAGGGRNRVEEIRTGFMALVKEADYVRWGSTKRVMNLRKELQDNLWEAVVENDFEKYWNVASKLVPLPAAPPAVGPKKPTRTTPPSASSSAGEGGRSSSSPSQEPDANGVKHVPLRVYLPAPPPPSGGGGASSGAGVVTVVQEPVAPTRRDGSPTTLRQALSQLVPLLFPPLPSSSSSSPAAPPPATTPPPPLAYPLIHGIYPPFETEVGWLGACMAGPDGWVNVVVVLDERGQPDVSGPGASSSSSSSSS